MAQHSVIMSEIVPAADALAYRKRRKDDWDSRKREYDELVASRQQAGG